MARKSDNKREIGDESQGFYDGRRRNAMVAGADLARQKQTFMARLKQLYAFPIGKMKIHEMLVQHTVKRVESLPPGVMKALIISIETAIDKERALRVDYTQAQKKPTKAKKRR